VPGRPEGLEVAARVDQHRGVPFERLLGVLVGRGDRPVAPDQAEAGVAGRHVVGELVEAPIGPVELVELVREDEGVRDHQAAGVVSDEQ
jgi:hypothetical protein